jgi:osmoprotectant transport system permease protein
MFQQAFLMLVDRWDFFGNLLVEHIVISSIAIIYATIIGLVVGIMISEHPGASKPTLVIVNLLYTIPSLALLGLLIPFTGVGDTTAIIALTVYGLLPMVKNTSTGLNNVNPSIIEAAKGMGSTRSQILFKIKLPLATPVIMTGFRNMVTMTIAVTTIASFIGAGGLGVAIYRGITTNDMAMVLAGSILVALLAIVVDLLLGAVESAASRNHDDTHRRRRVIAEIGIIIVLMLGLACYGGIKSGIEQLSKNETIKIADKSYTEQLVLGQILKQDLEANTDLKVELTSGISGGTTTIHPALLQGDYDLYPEYTGTAWNTVLNYEDVYHEDMFDTLRQSYSDMGLQWRGFYGFENTYGIAVTTELADRYGLETYSDLARISNQVTIGAESDFYNRPDGYDALCETYGFHFKDTMDLDTGLKYKAINAGEVDALVIYTTDGQLKDADVKILKDDLGFFPSYNAATVVRNDTIEKHPEVGEVLDGLAGTIDNETMSEMNHEVDIEGRDPADVAHDFLVSHNLIEE